MPSRSRKTEWIYRRLNKKTPKWRINIDSSWIQVGLSLHSLHFGKNIDTIYRRWMKMCLEMTIWSRSTYLQKEKYRPPVWSLCPSVPFPPRLWPGVGYPENLGNVCRTGKDPGAVTIEEPVSLIHYVNLAVDLDTVDLDTSLTLWRMQHECFHENTF